MNAVSGAVGAVLGIDTSCYTTSLALIGQKGAIFASVRRLLRVPAGERGLRQTEAVFQHVRALPELVAELRMACPDASIVAVAASTQPRAEEHSYMPVFVAGQSYARAVASLLGVPFYATDHQAGHLRAALVGTPLKNSDDLLALHLSGGTTEVLAKRGEMIERIGATLDISVGQLVDRIGVALGLGFPSGPALEALAEQGTAQQRLPVSLSGGDCHLSGAEAQALRWVEQQALSPEDIASEVFDVIARTILRLMQAAAERTGLHTVLLAGGVASSALLRESLTARAAKRDKHMVLHWARPELSGDNAVGVALIGQEKYAAQACK